MLLSFGAQIVPVIGASSGRSSPIPTHCVMEERTTSPFPTRGVSEGSFSDRFLVPVGTADNSPALQCWVEILNALQSR